MDVYFNGETSCSQRVLACSPSSRESLEVSLSLSILFFEHPHTDVGCNMLNYFQECVAWRDDLLDERPPAVAQVCQ